MSVPSPVAKARLVGKLWDVDLWMEDGDPVAGELADFERTASGGPRDLLVRIADVMAEVEFHDLLVSRLFVLRREGGHVVIAKAAPGHFFHEWGKQTNFSSSTPCGGCGGFTNSANPTGGHAEGCPLRIVLEVMES